MADTKDNKMLMEVTVQEDHFEFSSSIVSALADADKEYLEDIEQLQESQETIKKLTPTCDKLDYALAASCGALCGLFDVFLVGKPGESPVGNITDMWFGERTKDFAKLCGWEDKGKGLPSAIAYLERKFKIPYDQRGAGDAGSIVFGLKPENHHFKSLGHNPTLLGLFISILDQFSTPTLSHFVTDGKVAILQDADRSFELRGKDVPSKLFCAFVNWFGHLISDVSGSHTSQGRGMGIPSPFWAWTNDIIEIKSKLNIPISEFDKSINKLALTIYEEGFDFRFQATQVIPVLVNELSVRFVYSIRRLLNYYRTVEKEERSFTRMWKECEPFSNVTVKRMLTVGHGTFCLVDAGDAVIRGFATAPGSFDVVECALRLNIVGVGRFAISLYGEGSRGVKKSQEQENIYFLNRQKVILEDYIEGLKYLAELYDDRDLLTFVDDLKNSDMCKTAFMKSAELAQKRNVPSDEILRSKADIDSYFRGGNGS